MRFSTEQASRHFDNMMKALGIYEKVNNSNLDLKRWTKGEIKGDALMEARIDLIALCDKSFLKHTREEWADIFDKNNVWYERVQSYEEVIDDKQANAIGAFFDPGLGYKIVRGPMTFSTSNVVPNTGISPTVGQHNHEILKEIGYNNTDIKNFEKLDIISTNSNVEKRLS